MSAGLKALLKTPRPAAWCGSIILQICSEKRSEAQTERVWEGGRGWMQRGGDGEAGCHQNGGSVIMWARAIFLSPEQARTHTHFTVSSLHNNNRALSLQVVSPEDTSGLKD